MGSRWYTGEAFLALPSACFECFELILAAVLLRFCESAAGFREVFLKLAALGTVVRLLHMRVERVSTMLVCVDTLDNPQLQLLCLRSACANATEIRYSESLPGLLTRATLRAI